MFHGSSRIRRSPNAAWREIDGQVAILSLDCNRVRLLNEVGSFIWQRCEGATVDELVNAVCDAYDVDAGTAARDVIAFLTDLNDRGLIEKEEG